FINIKESNLNKQPKLVWRFLFFSKTHKQITLKSYCGDDAFWHSILHPSHLVSLAAHGVGGDSKQGVHIAHYFSKHLVPFLATLCQNLMIALHPYYLSFFLLLIIVSIFIILYQKLTSPD